MKRNYFGLVAACVAALAMAVTACDTPEDPTNDPVNPDDKPGQEEVTPTCPEKIEANVAPGETFKLTIEPNMDWELSIPLDVASYFKLLDGESSRFTLYGEAGTHEITIQVADKEEFDTPRVCEVTLKMDDQEQVIAELTRAAKERSVEMFACEYNTTDEVFVQDAEGNWNYSTTPMDGFEFVWSNNQWMQRLAVDANFKWTLRGAPEWMLITTIDEEGNVKHFNGGGKAGRTELFVRVDDELYPLENEDFNLLFCDITDQDGDGVITEADVRTFGSLEGELEGCKDNLDLTLASVINFDDKGLYHDALSSSYVEAVNGSVKAPKGIAIHKVALLADGTQSVAEEDTAWITVNEDEWNSEANGIGVWNHHFTIEAEDNLSISERKLQLVILPKTLAESLGGAANLLESGALKAEYADYVATTITQAPISLENDTIEPYTKGAMAAYNAKFVTLAEGMWPWMNDWALIPNAYQLTYKSNESGSELVFNIPFSRYEIYGFDGISKKYTDLDNCWITINHVPNNPRGEEHCYKIQMRLSDQYPNTLAGPDGENEATIIFYDANDNAYALIYCVMDPTLSTITGAEGDVKFANPTDAAMNGATLEAIPSNDDAYDSDMAAHGTLQYRLTLTPESKQVALIMPEYGMAWSYKSAITTELTADGKYTYVYVNSEESVSGFISYYKPNDPDNTIAVQLQVIYVVE